MVMLRGGDTLSTGVFLEGCWEQCWWLFLWRLLALLGVQTVWHGPLCPPAHLAQRCPCTLQDPGCHGRDVWYLPKAGKGTALIHTILISFF